MRSIIKPLFLVWLLILLNQPQTESQKIPDDFINPPREFSVMPFWFWNDTLNDDEMAWLANWCFVRGQNLLIPHAFYYSIRGPRFDERPPDVGPNAAWWKDYKQYADACRRLSWLNTDSRQVCNLAILCEATFLPDKSAKICFQNQRDFNYLEIVHLWEDAKVDRNGVHIAGMNYQALILDTLSYIPEKAKPILKRLAKSGRLIVSSDREYKEMFKDALVVKTTGDMIAEIDKNIKPDILLNPGSENIRYRHVVKNGYDYYILFNEEKTAVTTQIRLFVNGNCEWINPYTSEISISSKDEKITFSPYELKVLKISGQK